MKNTVWPSPREVASAQLISMSKIQLQKIEEREKNSKELIEAYDTTMDLISATLPSSSLAALQLSHSPEHNN